jgi:hypothetical protein
MAIEFEYLNNFGLKRVASIDTEPLEVKPPADGVDTFGWKHHTDNAINNQLSHIMWAFDLDMRPTFLIHILFCQIKYGNIKSEDWVIEGTQKQMDYWFLESITQEPLKPRIKYKFRLSQQGLRLYNLIDSLYIITDYNKDIVKETLMRNYEDILKRI